MHELLPHLTSIVGSGLPVVAAGSSFLAHEKNKVVAAKNKKIMLMILTVVPPCNYLTDIYR